jgi:uncharacterized protein
MRFNLFPSEYNFYNAFDAQADNVTAAADFFRFVVEKGEVTEADREQMREIEHAGDKIAYSVIDTLNKTFITPFDREDIHALAKRLDDINDMLRTMVNRMAVYRVHGVNAALVRFSKLIDESVKQLSCAVKGLRNTKNANNILKACVDINDLEGEGDSLRDKCLGDLFDNEKDPIKVIKLKELYQDAETVLDICKAVAHTIESILVKQA